MQATYDDATLLLRLYELRRDEKMREARAWFMATFKPKSVAELQELCPPGSVNNGFMRQVVTYWDMAASFVNGGVLNPELFFDNNRECLVVWLRVRKLLPEMRAAYKDASYWKHLESAGIQYCAYMEKSSPGSLEAFAARVGAA